MVNSVITDLVPITNTTNLVVKVTHHLSKKYNLSVLSLHQVYHCELSMNEHMISFPFLSPLHIVSKQLRANCVSYTIKLEIQKPQIQKLTKQSPCPKGAHFLESEFYH